MNGCELAPQRESKEHKIFILLWVCRLIYSGKLWQRPGDERSHPVTARLQAHVKTTQRNVCTRILFILIQ